MIIFLTSDRPRAAAATGRERLSGDLLRVLRTVAPEVEQWTVPPAAGAASKLRNGLLGYVDGASPAFADALVARLRTSDAETLFVDGSNFGRLAERVKTALPGLRVITFFHNCETLFFWGALKNRRSPKAALVLLSNYLAERAAVRSSDRIVTLNRRDGDALRSLFGRGETAILPMFLSEHADSRSAAPHRLEGGEDYVLFVGGAFYANVAGAAWFAREVAPRLDLRTLIVGSGFEKYRPELEKHRNVMVVGRVEDIAAYYAGSRLVVAPVFDGSGMKTKVAEALMFGKAVVGTPEALVGYEQGLGSACIACTSADEFVRAIRDTAADPESRAAAARSLFEREFSQAAAEARMKALLELDDDS